MWGAGHVYCFSYIDAADKFRWNYYVVLLSLTISLLYGHRQQQSQQHAAHSALVISKRRNAYAYIQHYNTSIVQHIHFIHLLTNNK